MSPVPTSQCFCGINHLTCILKVSVSVTVIFLSKEQLLDNIEYILERPSPVINIALFQQLPKATDTIICNLHSFHHSDYLCINLNLNFYKMLFLDGGIENSPGSFLFLLRRGFVIISYKQHQLPRLIQRKIFLLKPNLLLPS